MAFHDTWEGLVAEATQYADQILSEDVAPVAEDILRDHIMKDIYQKYTPKTNGWVTWTPNGGLVPATYRRRYSLLGYIHSKVEGGGVLFVTSSAKRQPSIMPSSVSRGYPQYDGDFLKLLESGHMGLWRGGFARPAVSNAQQEMNNSPRIKTAIMNGISKHFN